jgi:hypothetical protein
MISRKNIVILAAGLVFNALPLIAIDVELKFTNKSEQQINLGAWVKKTDTDNLTKIADLIDPKETYSTTIKNFDTINYLVLSRTEMSSDGKLNLYWDKIYILEKPTKEDKKKVPPTKYYVPEKSQWATTHAKVYYQPDLKGKTKFDIDTALAITPGRYFSVTAKD